MVKLTYVSSCQLIKPTCVGVFTLLTLFCLDESYPKFYITILSRLNIAFAEILVLLRLSLLARHFLLRGVTVGGCSSLETKWFLHETAHNNVCDYLE